MAVIQISRISHRRGLRIDLPNPLNDAEFGWCEDTRELFIGNGPFFGGNTQIITEHTDPGVQKYTYQSNTGALAITGFDPDGDHFVPNNDYQTVRSYQQKFDDIVSVRDYGAIGDGIIDDAPAITRALVDLYNENYGSNNSRKFRVLYFPAGTYRLSKYIPLYPNCVLVGDSKHSTVLFLDFNHLAPSDCVARTVDSQGEIQGNIGIGTPIDMPSNMVIKNITFQSNTPQTEAIGLKDIIKLEKASNIRFDGCNFIGTWQIGNIDESRAIYIDSYGDPSVTSGNYTFSECDFTKTAYGFNISQEVVNTYVVHCTFNTMYKGIKLGPVVSGDQPRYFRVSHSSFDIIDQIGFEVRSTGIGNISSYNYYGSFNFGPAVYFDATALSCVSISDMFENNTPWACSNKATNPRVRNFSSTSVVMNTQDQFQVPQGFCGNLIVSGDLVVSGNLVVSGVISAPNAPIIPSGVGPTYNVTTIPYSNGNVVFVEYALRVGGPAPAAGTYRVGVLKIIHDGPANLLANPVNIDISDNYLEMGGPPLATITMGAVLDNANSRIIVQVTTSGTVPTMNFNTRLLIV